MTGVCVSLFSAKDADSASAASEKVLRPRVPAAGPPERMLRLSIANMMMTSSNKAMAKPAEAAAEPPGPTPSEALLAEIRDELRKGRG